MGPGELEGAAYLGGKAAPLIGKWAGGVLGSGAEGAAAGALGAAGHDEDIGQGALWGGALGAAGGVPGGVVGRGGQASAPAVSADALHDAATETYKPLSNVLYERDKGGSPNARRHGRSERCARHGAATSGATPQKPRKKSTRSSTSRNFRPTISSCNRKAT